ncbi:alpha-mannosidase [Bombiscardovia nodaiensis]|uniref:Alpha-mannosidase n=1 Tax=Bombiscardovia nodaiensis TaxID=2932181 RepID=A0ABM8B8M6_9BIFI|nr:alpha-mannosidase [Bombiscardovia nodaiensis]
MEIKVDRELNKCHRFLRDRIEPYVDTPVTQCKVSTYVNTGEPTAPREFISRCEGGQVRFHPAQEGQSWGTTWGTTWFHIEGRVPENVLKRDQPIELRVDLGWTGEMVGGQCEGMVYAADGRALKGVHPLNNWVRLWGKGALGQLIASDGTFNLYLEAACNPKLVNPPIRSTNLGEAPTSLLYTAYQLGPIEVCLFDQELWEYARDLEVVCGLIKVLEPDSVRYWRLAKALQRSLNAYDDDNRPATLAQARAQLRAVLDQSAYASVLHENAIGHAHIDSAYLWPKRETRRKVARTVANVLALMEVDPNFLFAMSSAQQYAWLQEDYPELFARVRERISQGRFIPVGGMWVEADAMMPTGESLVRQITFGKRYFAQELQVVPRGIWLPDSFGYSGAFPQIARRAGFQWFLSQKISWNDTTHFPHHSFIWEGIDGTPIVTHFPPTDTYAAEATPSEMRYAEANARDKESIDQALLLYGFGDGGGGPTREMTGRLQRMENLEGLPTCQPSSPDDFFSKLTDQLAACDERERPHWVGELYLELHRATLTSQHEMKAGCRRMESGLRTLEYLGSYAKLACQNYQYPAEQVADLWKRLLLNQFHDILPGTSISWVHREAREDYRQDLETIHELTQQAVSALNQVFPERPRLQKATISPALWQVHTAQGTLQTGQAELPVAAGDTQPACQKTESGYRLSNGLLSLECSEDGRITSLVDLSCGQELVASGHYLAGYELMVDKPCERDAWELDRDAFLGPIEREKVSDIRVVQGQEEAGLVLTSTIGQGTTITTEVMLRAGSRDLNFRASVNWQERDRFLKALLPLNVQARELTCECQYGLVRRPIAKDRAADEAQFECSTHRFVHLAQGAYGLGIANDSTYGASAFQLPASQIGQPSPGVAFGMSLLESPTLPDPNTDRGHTYDFAWTLCAGASLKETLDCAEEMNAPQLTDVSEGDALLTVEEVTCEGNSEGSIVLDWVKPADDGSKDIVVRCYEALGSSARARLHPSTLLADALVRETDLTEEGAVDPQLAWALVAADQSEPVPLEGAELRMGPFQITTLRIAPCHK